MADLELESLLKPLGFGRFGALNAFKTLGVLDAFSWNRAGYQLYIVHDARSTTQGLFRGFRIEHPVEKQLAFKPFPLPKASESQ